MEKFTTTLISALVWLSLVTQICAAQIFIDESEIEGSGGGASHGDKSGSADVVNWRQAQFNVTASQMYSVISPSRRNAVYQIDCQVSAPGKFMVWIKQGLVISTAATFNVTVNRSDMFDIFGAYYCVAEPSGHSNWYQTALLVVTEMPDVKTAQEVTVEPHKGVTLTCCNLHSNSNTSVYRWYIYSEVNFRFEEIKQYSQKSICQLTLPYSVMGRDDSGKIEFTFYKCVASSDASVYQVFKAAKAPLQRLIDGRMTHITEYTMRDVPIDVAAMTVNVSQGVRVEFECKKSPSTDNVEWFFRAHNGGSHGMYARLSQSSDIDIESEVPSSKLIIKRCDFKNKGYYRCTADGTSKYAKLDIGITAPTIHNFGKGIYFMKEDQATESELVCEIPYGGDAANASWQITPSGDTPTFDIPVNASRRGFSSYIKQSSASNALVIIKFRSSSRLHNYQLECRLGSELDFVTLRWEQSFLLNVTVVDAPFVGFLLITCFYDARLRNVTLYLADSRHDTVFPRVSFHRLRANEVQFFFRPDSGTYWFKCSGVDPTKGNALTYSEPVSVGNKEPLMLDLYIDGTFLVTPNDPDSRYAKTEGQKTEFVCLFSNDKNVDIRPENVKLVRDGRIVSESPMRTDPDGFVFVLDNPLPGMSGKFYCNYNDSTSSLTVRSPEVLVHWCSSNQFMCDNKCRNASVICNGVRDCTDGSDEHPSNCFRFEINMGELTDQDAKGTSSDRPSAGQRVGLFVAVASAGLAAVLAIALLVLAVRRRLQNGGQRSVAELASRMRHTSVSGSHIIADDATLLILESSNTH